QALVNDDQNLVRGLTLEVFQPSVQLLSRSWIDQRSVIIKVARRLRRHLGSHRVHHQQAESGQKRNTDEEFSDQFLHLQNPCNLHWNPIVNGVARVTSRLKQS